MSRTRPNLRVRLVEQLARVLGVRGAPNPDLVERARAGVLNSGELIVLLPRGGTVMFSDDTTDLIRDVLSQAESANAVFPISQPFPPIQN